MLAAQAGYAQVNVSGVVRDDLDQTALVGVSVTVKGTTKGTVTDAKGKYALSVPNNATLVFSFTGFDAKTVEVGNRNIINVSLAMSDNILSEVVVVGYGTQKEKEVTGAVATIKADMIVKSPVSDLGAAIQGQIAGVNVQASSGRPGDNSNVQI